MRRWPSTARSCVSIGRIRIRTSMSPATTRAADRRMGDRVVVDPGARRAAAGQPNRCEPASASRCARNRIAIARATSSCCKRSPRPTARRSLRAPALPLPGHRRVPRNYSASGKRSAHAAAVKASRLEPPDQPATTLPLTDKARDAAARFSMRDNPLNECVAPTTPESIGVPYLHAIERERRAHSAARRVLGSRPVAFTWTAAHIRPRRAHAARALDRPLGRRHVGRRDDELRGQRLGHGARHSVGRGKRVVERYRLTDGGATIDDRVHDRGSGVLHGARLGIGPVGLRCRTSSCCRTSATSRSRTAISTPTSAERMPPAPRVARASSSSARASAGLFAAQALARAAADVTIVDRHNYHLFQPLLYQVATAGLPPSDVAWPIRSILRRQRNATVLLGEVTAVDRARRRRRSSASATLPFDYLVVATGSTHSYFGHDDWRPFAPGLKSIDDATRSAAAILSAFEAAEMADRRRATRAAAALRDRRRRTDGRRARGHDRGARALHARRRLPPHRPAQRENRARRSAVRACSRRSQSRNRPMRTARSRSSASKCASTRAVTGCDAGGVSLGSGAPRRAPR